MLKLRKIKIVLGCEKPVFLPYLKRPGGVIIRSFFLVERDNDNGYVLVDYEGENKLPSTALRFLNPQDTTDLHYNLMVITELEKKELLMIPCENLIDSEIDEGLYQKLIRHGQEQARIDVYNRYII